MLLVLTLGVVAFQHRIFGRDIVVTPRTAEAHIHAGYSDELDGGASRFIASGDPMRWACDVKPGAKSVYCGKDMIFDPSGRAEGIDMRTLESVTLVLDYRGPSETLRVHLKNADPLGGAAELASPKPNKVEFSVRQGRQTIVLRPSDFSVADWWLATRNFTPQLSRVQLNHVISVDIATGTDPKPGLHSIAIEKLTFRRSVVAPAALYLAILALWGALICGYILLRVHWSRQDAFEKANAEAEVRSALAGAARAAESANQTKTDFLARVSHELRTPLNAIVGYAQLMERDGVEDRHRRAVRTIHRSADHVVSLISDLLDLAKVEAGKMELHPSTFELAEFLESLVAIVQLRADEKGVPLISDVGVGLPELIAADEKKLRQILLNLLSNAVKFTDEGTVTLRVRSLETEAATAALRFEVVDTGAGIEAGDLDRLFRPFEQVGEGHKHDGSTGLGLSITQGLAGLMGAAIQVESRIGRGSRFWFDVVFSLPDGDTRDADIEPSFDASNSSIEPGARPWRVLAAEDALANQLILRAMLEPAGYEIHVVGNGREAYEAVQTGHYDVILMDARMPVMSGEAAALSIRAWEARTGRARTPMIALTGDVMAHHLAGYRASGMDGHVEKPIQIQELFAAIHNALDSESLALVEQCQ
ncbi:ATP-binding protein [Pseudomonas sp.]|uniref:ATP-binding protein n=1 Tax=Pseudomonas sp. TaxID=306 RepID=UPI0025FDCE39|nr:ATP-binding protein [Pseudomonas sp.]